VAALPNPGQRVRCLCPSGHKADQGRLLTLLCPNGHKADQGRLLTLLCPSGHKADQGRLLTLISQSLLLSLWDVPDTAQCLAVTQ